MVTRNAPFAAFVRHRHRVHVQGWLVLAVVLGTVAYLGTLPQEPLWLALPASLLAAIFVVSVGVALAALLRVPWWLLAPLTLASMACEWGLRRLLGRPWRRQPQARSWALSNPFAWWQGRSLRKLRKKHRSPTRLGPVIPLPIRPAVRPAARAPATPSKPQWSPAGLGTYIAEVFQDHWMLWMFSAPLWIMLWLWLIEDQMFIVALILALILWLLGSFVLIIPIAAALLALVSAFLVGANLTPLQRQLAVHHFAEIRAAGAQNTATGTHKAPAGRQPPRWVWPLLLGLWIGHAWGDDG